MSKNEMVKLKINGENIKVPAGSTIMDAAGTLDINIPVICFHVGTTPEGLCRQCVVEVEGWSRLAPACITPVADDMVILTESERIIRTRRTILEMLNASVDLSRSPEIQLQMDKYQVDRERFPGAKKRDYEILDDNPFYVRDYSQCVMCWRCVQACGEDMQYSYALGIGGRGHDSKIVTTYQAPMPETTCVFCGNCVGVCPTKALQGKTEYLLEKGMQHNEIRAHRRRERQDKRS